jgi:hypothetical protein
MRIGFGRNFRPFAKGLVAAALAACAVQPAAAEDRFLDRLCNIFGRKHARPVYSEPYQQNVPVDPQPQSPQTPMTPQTPTTPQAPETPAAPMASFGNEAGAAVVGVAALNTPNVMGNFLGTSKTITFAPGYVGSGGYSAFTAATNISNAKIADNNSPIPRDRFGYRYHFYSNSNFITGIGPAQTGAPLGTNGLGETFVLEAPYTKSYDTHLNGFEFEKTFLGGMASVDVRLPIVTTAASNQNLVFGERIPGSVGPLGGGSFQARRTPGQSVGQYGTEIGNMQVIFKAILFQTDNWLLSGGLGVGIPTGNDTRVNVVDFSDSSGTSVFSTRYRSFHVNNETWGLSPFIAGVYAPRGSRWFTQGFLEFETPLNENSGTFTEVVEATPMSYISPTNINQNFNVRESMLMHLSWNTGFWLVQNPQARWIRGIAPSAELHLTQSLTKGRAVTLQSDGYLVTSGNLPGSAFPPFTVFPQPAPTVGRDGNVTFLDMTVGSTFLVGDRTTLATGVAFPLLSGQQHRSYDFEFQLQLNWFFGPGGFVRGVPNF